MDELQVIVANILGPGREVTHLGRQFFVAPTRIIVEGVLPGSMGNVYYPREENRKDVDSWNDMPLMGKGHPKRDGKLVSARTPQVLEKECVGRFYSAKVVNDGEQVAGESWFDVVDSDRVDPRIMTALRKGESIEVSTGLYLQQRQLANAAVDRKGRFYTRVAHSYRPDHIAVLVDNEGACSRKDGCGILVNGEGGTAVEWDFEAALAELGELLTVLNAMKKQPSDKLDMTPDKACKILKDGEVNGKKLTRAQRGMFGVLCSKKMAKNEAAEFGVHMAGNLCEYLEEVAKEYGAGLTPEDKKSISALCMKMSGAVGVPLTHNSSTEGGQSMNENERKDAVAKLTGNCNCGGKDMPWKGKDLSKSSDAELTAYLAVLNAQAPTEQVNPDGSKIVWDPRTSRYNYVPPPGQQTSAPTPTPTPTVPVGNQGGTQASGTVFTLEQLREMGMGGIAERFGKPEEIAAHNFVMSQYKQHRDQIINQLTANIADPAELQVAQAMFAKLTDQELALALKAMPRQDQNNNQNRGLGGSPLVNWSGAATPPIGGGIGGSGTAVPAGMEPLVAPVPDYQKIMTANAGRPIKRG